MRAGLKKKIQPEISQVGKAKRQFSKNLEKSIISTNFGKITLICRKEAE